MPKTRTLPRGQGLGFTQSLPLHGSFASDHNAVQEYRQAVQHAKEEEKQKQKQQQQPFSFEAVLDRQTSVKNQQSQSQSQYNMMADNSNSENVPVQFNVAPSYSPSAYGKVLKKTFTVDEGKYSEDSDSISREEKSAFCDSPVRRSSSSSSSSSMNSSKFGYSSYNGTPVKVLSCYSSTNASAGFGGGGLFGSMLMDAATEVEAEIDADIASQCARKMERQEQEQRIEQERLSQEAAIKMDRDMRDSDLARQIQCNDDKEWQEFERRKAEIKETDEDLARRLAEEEEREYEKFVKTQKAIERKDSKLASKFQKEEVKGFRSSRSDLEKAWRNPKVLVSEDNFGVNIKVPLPSVLKMEVDLDEKNRIIIVRAVPKPPKLTKEQRLAAEASVEVGRKRGMKNKKERRGLDIEPVKFNVDLNKFTDVDAHDVTSVYDDKTDGGELRIQLKNVTLSHHQRGAFIENLSKRLRRAFSFKRKESGSTSENTTNGSSKDLKK